MRTRFKGFRFALLLVPRQTTNNEKKVTSDFLLGNIWRLPGQKSFMTSAKILGSKTTIRKLQKFKKFWCDLES